MDNERKKSYLQTLAMDRRYSAEVRLFGLKSSLLERFRILWEYTFNEKKNLQTKQLILTIVASLLPELCILVFMIILLTRIIEGEYTIGDYTLYSGLSASLVGALMNTVESLSSVYEDKLKVNTIIDFEAQENQIEDNGDKDISADEAVSIEFRAVNFSYPNTNRNVLENISFKVNAYEKVCLLGVNGAGKSTIIKLILRFYDVDEGEILINGQNIKQYTLKSVRKLFSTFFQDSTIYAFSLAENIYLSDYDKSDVNQVELASIEVESQFFENNQQLWADKTALFTSHRLSAVHLADRIILLDDGRITENGTHRELIDKNGRYAKLYKLQASKYV